MVDPAPPPHIPKATAKNAVLAAKHPGPTDKHPVHPGKPGKGGRWWWKYLSLPS